MAQQVDLFGVLRELDRRNLNLYERYRGTPEQKELDQMVNWLLVQWMTGSTSSGQHEILLEGFDELTNLMWFQLSRYPELQLKILACCGVGKTKHRFFKQPKIDDSLYEVVAQAYPDIRPEEVDMFVNKYGLQWVADLMLDLGYQSDDIRTITGLTGETT